MTAVVLSKLPEVHFQTVFVSLCTTAILAFSTQSFRLCSCIPLSWTKIWPATPHMQRKSLSHPAGTVICGLDPAKDESEKERCVLSLSSACWISLRPEVWESWGAGDFWEGLQAEKDLEGGSGKGIPGATTLFPRLLLKKSLLSLTAVTQY